MSRRWVADASPIIVLAEIDRVDLLPSLSDELIVPQAVKEEIDRGAEDDAARQWLQSRGRPYLRATGNVASEVSTWDLGMGESAVLGWAHSHAGWEAVIDDRAARRCAAALGIPSRGTLGIILLAKREEHVQRARPLLERAIEAGLHVSEELFQTMLELAGEE